MLDILISAFLFFVGAYILSKSHQESNVEKIKGLVSNILESARKLVAYLLIVLLFFFICGEIYAAWVFKIWPTLTNHFWFYVPIMLLILLVLYYYLF